MLVQISENGKVIGKLTTEQFMNIAKNEFGIGQNQFLQTYIGKYNQIKKEHGLKAEVVLK